MRRRRLLAGLSGLAGVGGLVGSGAFTSVSADRSVEVDVANDADALLALSPCGGPNGQYVTTTGGTVAIDLTGNNTGIQGSGDGVNAEAVTVADDVLRIENRGTQPVGVWLEVDSRQYNGTDRVQFYFDGDPSTDVVGRSNAYCLGVGESLCVGFSVDTTGLAPGDPVLNSDTMVVNAEAGVGCSPNLPGVNTGPLAYYPFDGDAVDATGNGFDGAVSGASFASGQSGFGQAASFDPPDDYVEIGGLPDAQLADGLTISAWIRPDSLEGPQGGQRIFADDSSGDPGSGYALSLGDPGPGRLRFFNRGKDTISLDTGAVVSTGTWYHVAAVYDATAGTRRIYLDGTEVAALTADTGTWQTDPGPATIGGETSSSGESARTFDGLIDEVRLYDRALSASEIGALAGGP